MNDLRKIRLVAAMNFRKWRTDWRIFTVAFCVLSYMLVVLWDVRRFARDMGIPVSPWVFPFLMGPSGTVLLMLAAVAFFGNAPFRDAQFPFVFARVGRKNWICGQLLYLVFASAAYTLFTVMASMLVLLPYLGFTWNWGTILDTVMNTSTAQQMGYSITLQGTETVFFTLRPASAMLLSIGLYFLCVWFLGCVIFCGNLLTERAVGTCIAGGFTGLSFLSATATMLSPFGKWMNRFSPVTWSSLNGVELAGSGDYPNIRYAAAVLLGVSLLLNVIAVLRFRKQDQTMGREG